MGWGFTVVVVVVLLVTDAACQRDEPSEAEATAAALASLTAASLSSHRRRHKRDEEMVCFESLGCFRDEGPFDYLDALPQPPDVVGTKFLLSTRRNPSSPQMIYYSNGSLSNLIDSRRPLKIIVHGFGSSCRRLWAWEMKEALLRAGDINLICVEWETGAALPNYVQAAANTRLVGKQLALLIGELTARGITDPSRVHLIGFSLGAHVAGFTGKQVANISRISGLDPAAPLFEGFGSHFRLDPTDARFVDVIHSNGDRLLKGGLGAFEPMGHVDFYPNGGKAQAGCNNLFVGAISDLFMYRSRSEEDGRSLCNHRRAYKFFTESVDPTCHLRGFLCTDFDRFLQGKCFSCGATGERCGEMGFRADRTLGRGQFYLVTRDTEPLCVNQFKVELDVSAKDRPLTYGAIDLTLLDFNGFNESFPITSESEEISRTKTLVKMLAAHPALVFAGQIQLRYVAYNGWLYKGGNELLLHRISITDAFGRIFSFCSPGTTIVNGLSSSLQLTLSLCEPLPLLKPWPSSNNEILTQQVPSLSIVHNISTHRSSELDPVLDSEFEFTSRGLLAINNHTYHINYPTKWKTLDHRSNISLLVLVPPAMPQLKRRTRLLDDDNNKMAPSILIRPFHQFMTPVRRLPYVVPKSQLNWGTFSTNPNLFWMSSPFAAANHAKWNTFLVPLPKSKTSDVVS